MIESHRDARITSSLSVVDVVDAYDNSSLFSLLS